MTELFGAGNFTLHSGQRSDFKIDTDALTDVTLHNMAEFIAKRMPRFGDVEGVPRGGLRLASALSPYKDKRSDILLIVDDVLTTGASMERYRREREALGVVIFARGPYPTWIRPLFVMPGRWWQ